jgi:RNA-binding protein PNO1
MEIVTAQEMAAEQVAGQAHMDDEGDVEVPSVVEFPALSAYEQDGRQQYLRIPVPPNRYTPLKNQWMDIYQPIAEHMKLQIRFNPKKRCVELRTSAATEMANAMTKSTDFVRAFLMGFEIRDAIALLRLDDLYLDSFEIKDVKTLNGEHLSRAIGRIAGQGGKTRHTIENATNTRIVLADTHIHILGSFSSIKIAKNAVVRLIMGSPPGKVYTQMRAVANRQRDRF